MIPGIVSELAGIDSECSLKTTQLLRYSIPGATSPLSTFFTSSAFLVTLSPRRVAATPLLLELCHVGPFCPPFCPPLYPHFLAPITSSQSRLVPIMCPQSPPHPPNTPAPTQVIHRHVPPPPTPNHVDPFRNSFVAQSTPHLFTLCSR